jgi:hypothetical protein
MQTSGGEGGTLIFGVSGDDLLQAFRAGRLKKKELNGATAMTRPMLSSYSPPPGKPDRLPAKRPSHPQFSPLQSSGLVSLQATGQHNTRNLSKTCHNIVGPDAVHLDCPTWPETARKINSL